VKLFAKPIAIVVAGLLAGLMWPGTPCHAGDANLVKIAGARYMSFPITDVALLFSTKVEPKAHVVVESMDAMTGFQKLLNKEIDGFMSFRRIDEDEEDQATDLGVKLNEHLVGWGAVALVVHRNNPVKDLTIEQVRKMFLGEIRNWKEVGGKDEPVVTLTRDEAISGTELFFREKVLDGSPVSQGTIKVLEHDINRAVFRQTGGLADARYTEALRGQARGLVKILEIKQDADSPAVMPTEETVKDRSYTISGPLYLYAREDTPSVHTSKFVEFCAQEKDKTVRLTRVQP
jgi:phosphate transport system substrate-binding protein